MNNVNISGPSETSVAMDALKPGQLAVVTEVIPGASSNDDVVIGTYRSGISAFSVKDGGVYSKACDLKVRLLGPREIVTISNA